MSEDILERVKRRAAEQGISLPADELPEHDADLIPELPAIPARSEDESAIDGILDGLGIVEAYRKWIGKSPVDSGGKTESIMVSCPKPDHTDANPSAWLNSDKGTWFCGACQQGGDKYDFAAWHFGMGVPDYKSKERFPELRKQMAAELGYVIRHTPSGHEYAEKLEEEPGAKIVALPTTYDPVQADFKPSINWRSLFPEGTFLRIWMDQTSKGSIPEEYYVWLGLMAVGAGIGPDATLIDSNPVKGNLFTCLVGSSGSGKSRAMATLEKLLRRALPYDAEDPHSTGIMVAATAASGEALIYAHQKIEYDPVNPKIILGYRTIRSLIRYNELADLIGRAARMGNSLKPILMDFYDAAGDISTDSRTSGKIIAGEPYAQFVTTTQTGAMEGLMTRADSISGMVNRIVFAQGTEKERHGFGDVMLDIEPAVRPLQLIRTWSSSGRNVDVSPEADAIFEEWFQQEFLPLAGGDEGNPILGRCDLLLKKLMLLFAANEQRSTVTASIAKRVLSLWPYIKGCYGVVEERVQSSGLSNSDTAEIILTAVQEWCAINGKPPTARDLWERKVKRKIKDNKLFKSVLGSMVDLELDLEITKAANGKPVERYAIHA